MWQVYGLGSSRSRQDAHRLGVAIQIGTVRYKGLFLTDPPAVPWLVVDYLAEQVGIADPSQVKRYGVRPQTAYDHAWMIRDAYGYHVFEDRDTRQGRVLAKGLLTWAATPSPPPRPPKALGSSAKSPTSRYRRLSRRHGGQRGALGRERRRSRHRGGRQPPRPVQPTAVQPRHRRRNARGVPRRQVPLITASPRARDRHPHRGSRLARRLRALRAPGDRQGPGGCQTP